MHTSSNGRATLTYRTTPADHNTAGVADGINPNVRVGKKPNRLGTTYAVEQTWFKGKKAGLTGSPEESC